MSSRSFSIDVTDIEIPENIVSYFDKSLNGPFYIENPWFDGSINASTYLKIPPTTKSAGGNTAYFRNPRVLIRTPAGYTTNYTIRYGMNPVPVRLFAPYRTADIMTSITRNGSTKLTLSPIITEDSSDHEIIATIAWHITLCAEIIFIAKSVGIEINKLNRTSTEEFIKDFINKIHIKGKSIKNTAPNMPEDNIERIIASYTTIPSLNNDGIPTDYSDEGTKEGGFKTFLPMFAKYLIKCGTSLLVDPKFSQMIRPHEETGRGIRPSIFYHPYCTKPSEEDGSTELREAYSWKLALILHYLADGARRSPNPITTCIRPGHTAKPMSIDDLCSIWDETTDSIRNNGSVKKPMATKSIGCMFNFDINYAFSFEGKGGPAVSTNCRFLAWKESESGVMFDEVEIPDEMMSAFSGFTGSGESTTIRDSGDTIPSEGKWIPTNNIDEMSD